MKDKLARGLNKSYFLPALILLLLLQASDLREESKLDTNIRFMFYNVENLFDTIDSPLDDNEFLPLSERRWDSWKYRTKLDKIAKVIIAGGEWEAPDIIGLCEIENLQVLDDLVSKTMLSHESYQTLYAKSLDRRGIGVGMIFKARFELLSSREYYPISAEGDSLFTRSVLFVSLRDNFDTLGVIINHWPSRRGGASLSDPLREIMADLVMDIISTETSKNVGSRKIVVMGDLNCNPDSYIMTDIIKPCNPGKISTGSCLYNITTENTAVSGGTYKYQGRWNYFDQVLISEDLRSASAGYFYKEGSFRVLNNNNLLIRDNTYKGYKPFSTWTGPSYKGGYSDHLPVLFDLELY